MLPMPPDGAAAPFDSPDAQDATTLVQRLDFPRCDIADLERGRDVLQVMLQTANLETRIEPFTCRTHRADLAAACLIVAALGFAWAARRKSRRRLALPGLALLAAVAAIGGGLDRFLPAVRQANLHVVVESRLPPRQEVILGAHYDSKTEPLDHVERTALFTLLSAATAFAGIQLWRRHRHRRAASLVAALTLVGGAAQLSAGRLLAPSHGIVDNAAAAALLVETATQYAAQPLAHTRLVFSWWAAEEQGAQGSAATAGATTSDAERAVINLECIGAGPALGFAAREWNGWRTYRADPRLRVAAQRAAPLRSLVFPVVTDAGSFLACGIPAITLVGLPRGRGLPRGLHRATDRLPVLDRTGVAQARSTIATMLRGLDDAAAIPATKPASPR